MGDTAVFGDMKLIAELYKPDLILIPIGGHFVMDPKDAAYATTRADQAEDGVADALRQQPVPQGHAGGVQGGAGPRRRSRSST